MHKMTFPFPSYELAKFEIFNSNLSDKINQKDIEKYLNNSWSIGKKEALDLIESNNNYISFIEKFNKENISINNYFIDNIIGYKRYYADYNPKNNEINLYIESIKLWAKSNNIDFYRAYNMTLAHEYFHYLENTKIGILSIKNDIPLIQIFNIEFGKSKFLILSEIGAYSFVNTLYKKGVI